MQTRLLVTLVLLASSVLAQDVRNQVNNAAQAKNLTSRIEPDTNVFGIPFGIKEDEFVAAYGKPTGYIRLNSDETIMIYGKSHGFVFDEAKLVGVRISFSIVDWKLTNTSNTPTVFDGIKWRLNNGLVAETSLKEVKRIIGSNLAVKAGQYSYATIKARVELDFAQLPGDGEGDELFKVVGVYVRLR
jgi:hypothetical protein